MKDLKRGELPSANNSLTVSVPEAAERLGISRGSAYKAVKSGELPVIRIGDRILVPSAALDRMLQVNQ